MKCEAIYAHSSEHSVRKMCKVLELCESAYYQWLKGENKRQEKYKKERELVEQVRKVFEETNRVYGCRRLRKALADRGIDLSEWKVRRIMRENGMYPLTLVKYKPGKKEKPDGRYFDNLLQQDFTSVKPNGLVRKIISG